MQVDGVLVERGATVYLLIFNRQHEAPFFPCHFYSSNKSSEGAFGGTKAQDSRGRDLSRAHSRVPGKQGRACRLKTKQETGT